jgi:uncharacterized protein (TIGR03067 family)
MTKLTVSNLVVAAIFLSLAAGIFVSAHRSPTVNPVDGAHVAEWVARLKDADPDVRYGARIKVISLGEAAVPLLIQLLEGNSRVERFEAACALCTIRSDDRKAAVPGLIRMLSEDDPKLRRAAIETLSSIGPSASGAVPALRELARKKPTGSIHPPDGLVILPRALARIQGDEAVPFLIELLHDADLGLDAAYALADIGPAARSAIPVLLTLAREEKSDLRKDILAESLDLIQLQGTWVMTAIERDGRVMQMNETATSPLVEWVIAGDRWTKGPRTGVKTNGHFWAICSPTPKCMDLIPDGGSESARIEYLIYDLNADELKIGYVEHNLGPSRRPKAFRNDQEPGVRTAYWRRSVPRPNADVPAEMRIGNVP